MAGQGLDTHQQVARWVQQNAKVVSLPGNSLLTTGSNPGALSGLGHGGTQQSTRLYDCENQLARPTKGSGVQADDTVIPRGIRGMMKVIGRGLYTGTPPSPRRN